MDVSFRPILAWPGKLTAHRNSSKFRASYGDTLNLLDRELSKLGARNVVIQLALQAADIRLDGVPRKDARPMHPGVILSFDSRHGPLSYPCDTFSHWEENLRAIALSLEHLRAVDRYGVTKSGEQYRGWTALPAPAGVRMTAFEAVAFIAQHSGLLIDNTDRATITAGYRAAAMKLHPDRGGNAEDFKKLQEAMELLGAV